MTGFAVSASRWHAVRMKSGKWRVRLDDRDIDTATTDARPIMVQPIMVPRNHRALAPVPGTRIEKLRAHLAEAVRASDAAAPPAPATAPSVPEREGFVARVARVACTLCKGWCCKDGGEHAYLDERTVARIRQTHAGLTASALSQLYIDRVPERGYAGSCIFHGLQGCTLDRAMRSDICNHYFCNGLGTYVTRDEAAAPVQVIAGEGATMRTSPVLVP